MSKPEISGIAPFFIVRNVPAALSFYRDRLGFDITFQGPSDDDIFFGHRPARWGDDHPEGHRLSVVLWTSAFIAGGLNLARKRAPERFSTASVGRTRPSPCARLSNRRPRAGGGGRSDRRIPP